ncbi:MAG TPA: hypothetical protein VF244_08230, partial [Acidimicrobiales bacterium]
LAVRCHMAIDAQRARGETVDERLLVVTHGVIVEGMRRGRAAGITVETLEEYAAEIDDLPYDREEGERYAAELASIRPAGGGGGRASTGRS